MVMGSRVRFLLIGGELINILLKKQQPTNVWRANNFTKLTINETTTKNQEETQKAGLVGWFHFHSVRLSCWFLRGLP